MTLNDMKGRKPQSPKEEGPKPKPKKRKTKKYAMVAHVYFDGKDMDLYKALCAKYPSRRKGAANLTQFVREHATEIMG